MAHSSSYVMTCPDSWTTSSTKVATQRSSVKQVGERTKPAEELAAEEQQRLERLEAQRLKRLRGTSGDDLGEGGSASEEEDGLTGLGGFAARRAKRRKREAQGQLLSDSSHWFILSDTCHSCFLSLVST